MLVGLRLNGKAIGIDPSDASGRVYADRDAVNAWELVELTPRGAGRFDARFTAANRQLTLTPEGHLESRPAGTLGAWELPFATEQPDGSALLYRIEADGTVPVLLTIEAHS